MEQSMQQVDDMPNLFFTNANIIGNKIKMSSKSVYVQKRSYY
jgi:hypothetical protein